MDHLSALAPEILSHIFESLEYIGDAEHLARCCKQLSHSFCPQDNRVRILRSIIKNSNTYDQDIQLCHFIDKNAEAIQHYERRQSLPTETEPEYEDFMVCLRASRTNEVTTAKQVLDIQRRRNNLRVIIDLYCNQSIQRQYEKSAFPYTKEHETDAEIARMHREGPLDKRNIDLVSRSSSISLRQAPEVIGQEQERLFVDALVACWLHVEAYNLARSSNYRKRRETVDMFERTRLLWEGCIHQRTLLQQLHVLEVYDFVYGFLLRKVFFNWDETRLWFAGEYGDLEWESYLTAEGRAKTAHAEWNSFVGSARLSLRPLDIASLTISGPPKADLEKLTYLRCRGMFTEMGSYLGKEVGVSDLPETWFDLIDLEEGVIDRLNPKTINTLNYQDSVSLRVGWNWVRREWPSKVRDTLFNDPACEDDILEDVLFYMDPPVKSMMRSDGSEDECGSDNPDESSALESPFGESCHNEGGT